MQVIIIGAGTGGLCLAQGLHRAGIDVAVYERDRGPSGGLLGYRVGIDADGKRALRANLSPELYQTFLATCARRGLYGNQLTKDKKFLFSAGPADLPANDRPSEEDIDESVSRMTLRQVLLTGLDDIVRFGKEFIGYEHTEDGRVTARFADGTSATGDLLVGAEGANSPVRKQYLPHASTVETGLIGITCKAPLTEETRALLPERMLRGVSMIHGDRGNMCIIHVMQFDWDIPPFDNTDYIMFGFAAAKNWLPDNVLSLRGRDALQVVLDRTTDWHPDFRTIFALGDPASCFPLSIRTSEPIPAWPTTNVTLLGDAIHTMTPGRGVGANTALRDARLLTRTLVRAARGLTSLLDAVHEYETTMTGYAWDAVIKSRAQMDGNAIIHRAGLGGAFARAGMRTAMRVMDHLPPVKRKLVAAESSFRGRDRDEA